MCSRGLFSGAVLSVWLVSVSVTTAIESPSVSKEEESNMHSFQARGVIKELGVDGATVVVQHEAVAGYMPAMTMPFKVREPQDLVGLRAGDRVSFRLRVTDTQSWIDQISRIAAIPAEEQSRSVEPQPANRGEGSRPRHSLLAFKFTNELDQAVALDDFHGQALAITFFFTRCPIPDYCPRLSKNFQEAARKLRALPGGPTNWHFLSVSFDTDFDNPQVLKAYGELYHYDPTHWSFLTGPADQIGELARLSDVKFERDGGSFNHNFRTLIVDAAGHLQMVFPTGGDLAEAVVAEILKAAAITNQAVSQVPNQEKQHDARSATQDAADARFHGG